MGRVLTAREFARTGVPKGAMVFVVYGEEPVQRMESVDLIRDYARSLGFDSPVGFTVDTAYFKWHPIENELGSQGLFSDKKFVEVDASLVSFGVTIEKACDSILQKVGADTIFVLILGDIDYKTKQKAFYQSLTSRAVVVESVNVTLDELPNWIVGRLEDYNLKIDREALEIFAQRVEGNLLAAKQEVEKLSLLFEPNHVLSVRDIEDNVGNFAAFDMREFLQIWTTGDVYRTNRFVTGMRDGDPGQLILLQAFVLNDLNGLLSYMANMDRGRSHKDSLREARLFGDKAQYLPMAARRVPKSVVMESILGIGKMDMMAKGAMEGDPWDLFREVMLNLAGQGARDARRSGDRR